MNKRFGAIATLVAAVAAAAGLFASPSNSASGYPLVVAGVGSSPSTLEQASNTISISARGLGDVNELDGPYIGFGGWASPFKRISFLGGSNWHVTAMNSFQGSNCSLTPTNGGATCSFADPSRSVVNGGLWAVDTHFSGTPPTTVAGQVVYADDSTETFSAPVTYPPPPFGSNVALTGAGPTPNTLKLLAGGSVVFGNTDSVPHTVVFANGLCSLTVTPHEWVSCKDNFPFYVGSYAYTVDGKLPGTVVTTPLPRSVTLTARTHTTLGSRRLTLHGQVVRNSNARLLTHVPLPVIVLARHNSKQPFEPIATVRARFQSQANGTYKITSGWKFKVQPNVTTTYIATVTAQRLCYYPASRCEHPQGQVWSNAKSRPFTVRIRK